VELAQKNVLSEVGDQLSFEIHPFVCSLETFELPHQLLMSNMAEVAPFRGRRNLRTNQSDIKRGLTLRNRGRYSTTFVLLIKIGSQTFNTLLLAVRVLARNDRAISNRQYTEKRGKTKSSIPADPLR